MDAVYFTVAAVVLYFAADAILDWIEQRRGARFENRQLVFFAIILPLALMAFALIRSFTAPAG